MNPLSSIAKNITAYALLALLSLTSHSTLNTRVSYQDIANAHLRVIEAEGTSDTIEDESEEGKPSLDVKELSQHERLTKTFELLAQCEDTTDQDITVNHLLRELEIFHGHGANPEKSVFNCINRTTTSFGEALLAYMLANPTTDTKLIQRRQALVQLLLTNKELRANVEEILNQVLQNESAFLTNWKEDDKLTKEAIESLYFGKFFSYLNSSPSALEGGIRLSNLNSCFPLVDPFFFACISYLGDRESGYLQALKRTLIGYKEVYNPFDYIKDYKNLFSEKYKKEFIEQHSEENIKKLSDQLGLEIPVPSESEVLAKLENTQKYAYHGLALRALLVAGYTYFKYNQTSKTLTLAANKHKGHAYLQTKLLGLARILNAAENIDNLIDCHPTLNNGLVHGEELQNLLFYNDNTDLKSFVSTLQTRTFKGSPSFFSRMGRVLATAKQAETIKDALIPLIHMIGELDACLSIAKLFEEHEASDAHYCFVEFEQKETPYLNLQEFWHPFIGKDNAVTNSIELGTENTERSVILTGSNTGGKSTLLKAVSINLLFAHTIGIVPSSSAAITPFELISTSLNLSDNTAAGISLFKAEVLRAKNIMNQVSSLPDNAHAFLIIDEMFTGTNAKNGADAALSFAKKIADYRNVMYIFATHFPLVTTLGNENNTCANYCMDIYKDEDGSLHPTYTITPGISTQNVAENILEEELGDYS